MSNVDLKNYVPEDEQRLGFWTSLDELTFEEGDTPQSWIHAVSYGTYDHPLYGKLQFTRDRIKRFADNINNKVRDIDLAIDYAHKSDDKAAGWMKAAEVRSNGLWVLVEWTKNAADAIRNKEFKYFSPEIWAEWKNPKTGEKVKDLIVGGGLTNRPFLKDLLPVNLSEVFGTQEPEERKDMDLEKLREALKLSEDATEEDILKAVQELSEEPEPPKGDPPATPPVTEDDDIIELSEKNPAVKKLLDRVAVLETSTRLSEVNATITKLQHEGKYAVPPAAAQALKELWTKLPQRFDEELTEILNQLSKTGMVKLGESGSASGGNRTEVDGKSATERFQAEVAKLQEAEELDYATAASLVSDRNEQLFEEYRREQFEEVE